MTPACFKQADETDAFMLIGWASALRDVRGLKRDLPT
jgi:hypothetical protein